MSSLAQRFMALNALPSSGIGLCFMVWFISHQAFHLLWFRLEFMQAASQRRSYQSPAALHRAERYANPLNTWRHKHFYYMHSFKQIIIIPPEDTAHICATTAMYISEKMITRFSQFQFCCSPLKNDYYLDTKVENV